MDVFRLFFVTVYPPRYPVRCNNVHLKRGKPQLADVRIGKLVFYLRGFFVASLVRIAIKRRAQLTAGDGQSNIRIHLQPGSPSGCTSRFRATRDAVVPRTPPATSVVCWKFSVLCMFEWETRLVAIARVWMGSYLQRM